MYAGLTFSNDKLLQSRLFSYTDAQRYRLGTNYQDLPINQPRCPFHANEYDGAMQTRQKDEEVDYWPSTFRKEEVTADGSETTTNSENVNVCFSLCCDHFPSYLHFLGMLPRAAMRL